MNNIKSIIYYIDIYKKKIVFISLIIVSLIGIFCFFIINDKYSAKENITINSTNVTLSNEEDVIEDVNNDIVRIKVDVKGAVKTPGVYELEENSRVIDAINAAGGLIKSSNTKYLNLSKKLKDEYVILVNTESEIKELKELNEKNNKPICETITNVCVEENKTITSEIIKEKDNKDKDDANETSMNALVNINTANIEELSTLNGIGSSIAQKIIDYRNTTGLFNSTQEILNVSGIGEKLYEKIKDNITV